MFERDRRHVIDMPTRREEIWLCVGLYAAIAAGIAFVVLVRTGVL